MTNNDILRRLRYSFNYTNLHVAKIIAHVDEKVSTDQVGLWIQKDNPEPLEDKQLCLFLDGLIIEKRGARPDSPAPKPLEVLSRNAILKKLRIALSLRDEGMVAVFENADFTVTKAELGSFFRNENQRNYSDCPEQVLRKFIHGLGQEAESKPL